MTTVSMLLKSCAMPPVSRPTASIFCDCRNCASPLAQRGGVAVALPRSGGDSSSFTSRSAVGDGSASALGSSGQSRIAVATEPAR